MREMVTLIIGGSGSGKSAYAEEYAVSRSGGGKRYYIATMRAGDRESLAKIARHRKARSGKGFITVEQPVSIEKAAEKTERFAKNENTALLECVSNLTANEMFSGEKPEPVGRTADRIVRGIERMCRDFGNTVIVTNNVFEDGNRYGAATEAYMKAMGDINRRLAAMADEVIEVTAGIPVVIKGRKRDADR